MKYSLIKKLHLPIATLNCVDATNDFVFAKDLEELLQNATVVYGQNEGVGDPKQYEWSRKQITSDTHKALLLAIEELTKEPCQHEPKVSVLVKGFDLSKATYLHQIPEQFYCLKCGVELIAEYKAKDLGL